ncbi:hypothetical protein J8N05_42465 [Streptomyces sp. BH-SS-21]|uniref:Uncharacterized protein n=1 Tax=Streptomyces liliiviolaceus TaxID=2823109 RepID=A0A940YD68_9ACTN|nr:hypothetical protein [Streptomyces liliiviolaceus]MBQ0854829.1 hypothetical protein [Streptomyces liliiviolaceus]
MLLRSTGLRLPLDAYLLSPGETTKVTEAHRVLVRRCMVRFGFDYPPVAEGETGGGLSSWTERRYGITDPAEAAVRGYRLRAPAGPASAADPGPRERIALTGKGGSRVKGLAVPEGGCAGEAGRRLRAGGPGDVDRGLAQSLSTESYERSVKNKDVQAVTRQWSRCMRANGLDYANPLDPPKDPRFQGTAVSTAERDTAKTDVGCKKRTNLVGVWFTAEAAVQRSLIHRNHEALARVAAMNRTELTAAQAVLPK